MYGLKQAARIAFDNIVKILAPHGYFPVQESPVLWNHHNRSKLFTLRLNDFGIKANSMEDAHHLINATRKYFKCSIGWEDQNCIGFTLDWDYAKKYADVSMHVYIPTLLHKFQHKPPVRPQDASHPWNKPVYGKYIKLDTQQSSAQKINSEDTNRVQSINGIILFSCIRPNHAPRPQQNIHLPICTGPIHNGKIQPSTRLCINTPKRHYSMSRE